MIRAADIVLKKQNRPITLCAMAALLLLILAFLIVHTQYRVRKLTMGIERAQSQSQRLMEEKTEIDTELSRVRLPSYVAEHAKAMGMVNSNNEDSVHLTPKPVPRFVTRQAKGGRP